ncbi:MAG: DUF1285 domain-containing protein [Candidatus Rokubacteria bacterium]|nr:DUF1285 domain-containing protein [Candidatus Rokubacteria bacterium]
MTAAGHPAHPGLPRLSITRDGEWRHEGETITHARILDDLWTRLQMDAAGYYLLVGSLRVPVEVEDAPFVVVRVELDQDPAGVVLSDGSREPLALDTLRLGPGEVPYCRVKGGRFEARLGRAAAWQLLQAMETDETTGEAALLLRGRRHIIPRVASG